MCRVLNNPPSRYRTKNISQQAVANAPDGVDGNSKVGGVVDRHTDGLESEGGQASSPYDMTSVFGLKVSLASNALLGQGRPPLLIC